MIEGYAADLVSALRVQYRSWFAVISREGIGDLDAILADEWEYTNYDGLVRDKATYMAHIRSVVEDVTLVGPYDLTVREYGSMVLVVGGYHVARSGDEDVRLRFTAAWQFRDARWQCLAHHNSVVATS